MRSRTVESDGRYRLRHSNPRVHMEPWEESVQRFNTHLALQAYPGKHKL